MLNRAAIVLRYKEPAVRWINEVDPEPGTTMDEVNRERTVYLISNADGDSDEAVFNWVSEHYQALFESELQEWYDDPELWPSGRTFKLFQNWFYVECHTVIFDTVGGELHDDEI